MGRVARANQQVAAGQIADGRASKELRIQVQAEGDLLRKFAWIRLLPPKSAENREAISVGFADRGFLVEEVEGRVTLADQVHTQQVDLRQYHKPDALKNPHFTFHAP